MENEEHFFGKVAQKAVIEKDGKVLVSRDVGETNFDLPGGRLNVGELLEEGLAREIKEELGIDIEVEKPFFAETFILSRNNEPHLLLAFRAKLSGDQEFKLAPDEIEEVRWIGREDIETTPLWSEYKRALHVYFGDK